MEKQEESSKPVAPECQHEDRRLEEAPWEERGFHTKSSAIDWAPISMERLLS